MSDTPASSPTEPKPVAEPSTPVEPTFIEPVAAESAAEPEVAPEPVEPTPLVEPVETSTSEPTPSIEPVETSTTPDLEPVVAEPAPAVVPMAAEPAPAAFPVQQPVYIAPPVPPKKRGNRIFGVLFSVLGAIVFAALYALVSAFIIDVRGGNLFGATFVSFLSNAYFWAPVVVFLVGMILLVLLLNRAGWWVHVFGSVILAVAVYFGTIGLLLFVGNTLHGSPVPITFAALAVDPWVLAAVVVARESSIWIGLAIAARGRRVKTRNVEARAAFDREQEQTRAEYAGMAATA